MTQISQKKPMNPAFEPLERRNLRTSRFLWFAHFAIGLLVLIVGVSRNGGRKYISGNPKAMQMEQQCQRIYIDVLTSHTSTSPEYNFHPDAIICCNNSNSSTSLPWWKIFSSYEHGLCSRKLKSLPFAKSFTRFPDSWLLCIIPLLCRIVIALVATRIGSTTSTIVSSHTSKLSTSIKRLGFYVFIMLFRGFVLYIFISDMVMKNYILKTILPLSATGTIIDLEQEQEPCWYSNYLLRKSHQSSGVCHGQLFDFSDHIILFFAHYYPLFIIESIICVLHPFWPLTIQDTQNNNSNNNNNNNSDSNKLDTSKVKKTGSLAFLLNTALPIILLLIFGYLNLILLASLYITSTYFHTAAESIAGYVLSLLVQIPVGFIVWSSHERCAHIRYFTGLAGSDYRDHVD